MFYIYLQNVKSATGPHVTELPVCHVILLWICYSNVLMKQTAVNCLLKHTVCIMSSRKSSLNVKVTMTCFHLHHKELYNSGSHTEFKSILLDKDANHRRGGS